MIIRTASPPGFFIASSSSPITPIHSHSSHHIDISTCRYIDISNNHPLPKKNAS